MMDRAVLADKKNPLPLYQKANILVSMDELDGALAVLEELKEYAPCESSVYALMGNIYKRRNMYDKAMLHFGLALDLKPSATDVASIKVTSACLSCPWTCNTPNSMKKICHFLCLSNQSFLPSPLTEFCLVYLNRLPLKSCMCRMR